MSDILDSLAEEASLIPGFRLLTLILGANPISMEPVKRSAANILRTLVELMPGGALITQALDNHGILEKVGQWVGQQLAALGLSAKVFKNAISEFLGSFKWSDIASPSGVWKRARRIFTEPIARILNFAKGLVGGIVKLIKDAILHPLAGLVGKTRGYGLLKALLGKDPITGDPYPRTAETLIGGFMKLIGEEEVWNNIKKANAVPRAWGWFQDAVKSLVGFVKQIPKLFVKAFQSLELIDLVLVPRAFLKVASVFGGFIKEFTSWAFNAVWTLLQIIFEVLMPGAIPYLKKAGAAFKTILKNPVGFVGNLVKAAKLGFQQFASKFGTHLKNSLIKWITGALAGANIYIPQSLEFRELIKFVLSVLGLTWQNIRRKLVKVLGEPAVKAMEIGFDLVVTLVREGPAAAWEKIKEQLTNLRDMVLEGIISFVSERIVQAAVTKLLSMLSPAGAFIQAVIAIYNTVMFFIERMKQIIQVAMAFIDSISAIARGVIAAAANRVEQTLAGLLTLAISFLARIAGLGKVSDAVIKIIDKLRARVDKAIDKVIDWIVTMGKKLFGKILGKKEKPDQRTEEQKKADLDKGVSEADRLLTDPETKPTDIAKKLGSLRKKYRLARLELVRKKKSDTEEVDHILGEINPTKRGPDKTKGIGIGDTKEHPIDIPWFKPALKDYLPIQLARPEFVADARKKRGIEDLTPKQVAALEDSFIAEPTTPRSLDELTIGVTNPMSQTEPGFVFQAAAKVSGNTKKNAVNRVLKKWGYSRTNNPDPPTDGDHVMEKQLGGPDKEDNVWPLNSKKNQRSGGKIRGVIAEVKRKNKIDSLKGKWIRLKF